MDESRELQLQRELSTRGGSAMIASGIYSVSNGGPCGYVCRSVGDARDDGRSKT